MVCISLLAVAASLLAAPDTVCGAARSRAWIDPHTRTFRDAAGRHLILHGVSVVYKMPPYLPSDGDFDPALSLNDADIDDLQSWGINFVRLGVMWEAVEREEGVYDGEYMSKVEAIINRLGERGIYTMVDAHQDVWARMMCGEGFPNFYAKAALARGAYCFGGPIADAILGPIVRHFGFCKPMDSYGMRKDADGNYNVDDCKKATAIFSDFYTSPEALTLANALWNNVDGLQDKFIDFWAYVSNKLAPNPHVIGFDPLNEPFASWSSPFQAISMAIPGRFDRAVLQPLYERVHAANQAGDPSSILLFEPSIFPDDNPWGVQELGMEAPPGGEVGSAHHAVNMHTYCCELASQADVCAATGEPAGTAEAAQACWEVHRDNLHMRSDDAKRFGIPMLVSEFGACMNTEVCAREVRQVADGCDERLASWVYWQFKTFADITTTAGDGNEGFYTDDRQVQVVKVKAISRTYLRATQGTVKSMNFDSSSGAFEAAFEVDTAIDAPTELHALKSGKGGTSWYPTGFELTLRGPGGTPLAPSQVERSEGPAANKVSFKIVDPALSGQIVIISLQSKAAVFFM